MVSIEQVREVLRRHWLTGVCCDHEAGTNAAACFCSVWRSDTVNSPVAAAGAWIDHVVAELIPPHEPAAVE
jgi:hypothetical protein